MEELEVGGLRIAYERAGDGPLLVLAGAYAGWAGSLPADVVDQRLEQSLRSSDLWSMLDRIGRQRLTTRPASAMRRATSGGVTHVPPTAANHLRCPHGHRDPFKTNTGMALSRAFAIGSRNRWDAESLERPSDEWLQHLGAASTSTMPVLCPDSNEPLTGDAMGLMPWSHRTVRSRRCTTRPRRHPNPLGPRVRDCPAHTPAATLTRSVIQVLTEAEVRP